ncbi:MAG: glycosyl transferase family 51, partial [Hyphomicrobium sp.]
SLSHWGAARRGDLRLHFAKTGTQVTSDPNATVDAWISGGLQFANGAAYSYVVVVGTGSTSQPWATSLHAAQVAAPLLNTMLEDLALHAKANPRRDLLPPPRPIMPVARPTPVADAYSPAAAANSAGRRGAVSASEQTLRAFNPN